MGAASGDLPGMAAQSRYLAGKIRADSAGICADGGGNRAFRTRSRAGQGCRPDRRSTRPHPQRCRAGRRTGAPRAHRIDRRFRPTIHGFATTARFSSTASRRTGRPRRKSRSIGASTRGAKSTAPSISTTSCPQQLGERYGFEVIEPGIVLEGGSIDVNGDGHRCSPPNRACSTPIAIRSSQPRRNRGIPAWSTSA